MRIAINRFGTSDGTVRGTGIVLQGPGNVVEANFLGTDITGTIARPNRYDGVWMSGNGNRIGGTTAGARNVISANGRSGIGVSVGASGNLIQGNLVGLNRTGTADLGNGEFGIHLNGATQTVVGGTSVLARNVISGNDIDGIRLGQASGTLVRGNYIGTNISGSGKIGNSSHGVLISGVGNALGGAGPGEGNVVSGNQNGIAILEAQNTSVVGNLIGVDATGLAGLGNNTYGVNVNTSTSGTTIQSNVLSGNLGDGVILNGASSGSLLQGNFIGAARDGTTLIPNLASGVTVSQSSSSNTIGTTLTGAGPGNVIAGNASSGVVIEMTASGNTVLGNAIFSNAGLGIDLAETLTFEDQADSIPFNSPFPASYQGITWTNWRHYAPYTPNGYFPDGVNAIFAAVDGAKFTFFRESSLERDSRVSPHFPAPYSLSCIATAPWFGRRTLWQTRRRN